MMEMHAFQNAKRFEIPSQVGPESPLHKIFLRFCMI